MKKRLYLLVAVVLLLGLLPATIAAEGEVVMYVSDINPSIRFTGNGGTWIGLVTILDEYGNPVPRARVTALLTLTDFYGNTILEETITATTTSQGVATFRATGTARTFCVEVTSVAKKGYIYDPDRNVETRACFDILT